MTYWRPALSLVLILLLAAVAVPVLAQSLEQFSLPHVFALPTVTTTRDTGMGGFVSCLKDIGFPNPAFAATLTGPQALLRYSNTDFEMGPTLKAFQASAAWPGTPGVDGYQITYFNLDSDPALTRLGPLMDMHEQDLAVHYARQVGPGWSLGIGVSPTFKTSTSFTHPVFDTTYLSLDSTPRYGFRLGSVYQLPQDGWIGAIFGYYAEEVNASGVVLPVQVVDMGSANFYSTEYAVGASQMVAEDLRAAVEYFDSTTRGNDGRQSINGWRYGLEWTPEAGWAVRAGINDKAFSAGAGVELGDWSLQYAFVDGWNKDTVAPLFGDSTTHQVELRYHW